MVMENEIRLGDIMDKLTPSDRVVIYNAARQVVLGNTAAGRSVVVTARRLKQQK